MGGVLALGGVSAELDELHDVNICSRPESELSLPPFLELRTFVCSNLSAVVFTSLFWGVLLQLFSSLRCS